jgi:hypothetical protein
MSLRIPPPIFSSFSYLIRENQAETRQEPLFHDPIYGKPFHLLASVNLSLLLSQSPIANNSTRPAKSIEVLLRPAGFWAWKRRKAEAFRSYEKIL